jgi:hypothetical protein
MLQRKILLLALVLVLPSLGYAASFGDELKEDANVAEQYNIKSKNRRWFSLGVDYSGSYMPNDFTDTLNSAGNGVTVSAEIFIFNFLSFYTGYQFMSWSNDILDFADAQLFDNRVYMGAKLYIAWFYFGVGAVYNWANGEADLEGPLDLDGEWSDEYWSGYIDFGFDFRLTKNLSLNLGSTIYCIPWDRKNVGTISPAGVDGKDTGFGPNYTVNVGVRWAFR